MKVKIVNTFPVKGSQHNPKWKLPNTGVLVEEKDGSQRLYIDFHNNMPKWKNVVGKEADVFFAKANTKDGTRWITLMG